MTDDETPSGQVVSNVPGRVRIRLPRSKRHILSQIRRHLASQPGIEHVAVNDATGSLLVHFDDRQVSSKNVLGMVRDAGAIVHEVAGAVEGIASPGEGRGAAKELSASISDLDQRLSTATGRTVDLTTIVPLALGALGLRQLLVEGFATPSGLMLLGIAIATYGQLHRAEPRAMPAGSNVATSAGVIPRQGRSA